MDFRCRHLVFPVLRRIGSHIANMPGSRYRLPKNAPGALEGVVFEDGDASRRATAVGLGGIRQRVPQRAIFFR